MSTKQRLSTIFARETESAMEMRITGISSLNLVRIVVAIENEFGFEFPDSDLDLSRFETLEDLATYIEARMQTP